MDVQTLMEKATSALSVSRVFGPAYERDGTLVIPVAFIAGGGGGGANDGPQGDAGDGRSPGAAAGQGGGFGLVSWPLGVYVVREDGVRFVPAVDATRIVIAGLGLLKLLARRRSRRGT
jgi:uncharacterized spore protein YtfJ